MPNIPRLEHCRRRASIFLLCPIAAGSAGGLAQSAPDSVTVKPLLTKDLVGIPGKEAVLLTVDYLPGGASIPHRHDAQVFLYVVEGSNRYRTSNKHSKMLGRTSRSLPSTLDSTTRWRTCASFRRNMASPCQWSKLGLLGRAMQNSVWWQHENYPRH